MNRLPERTANRTATYLGDKVALHFEETTKVNDRVTGFPSYGTFFAKPSLVYVLRDEKRTFRTPFREEALL